jgi:CheY-like chemotaxis protein
MRVLIVDDNEQIRQAVRSLIADLADEFYECSDGSEAFAAFSTHQPDLVLMDLEMKGMDGLTATKRILDAYPEARVAIVTVYDDAELREASRLAGAYAYVVKEDLISLRQLLGQSIRLP